MRAPASEPWASVPPAKKPRTAAERRAALRNLKQARGAHAAADAHRHDHELRAPALALDERVAYQARAAHAVGMAERDGAAVDVEPVVRDADLVAAVEHLHGERFVQL